MASVDKVILIGNLGATLGKVNEVVRTAHTHPVGGLLVVIELLLIVIGIAITGGVVIVYKGMTPVAAASVATVQVTVSAADSKSVEAGGRPTASSGTLPSPSVSR